MQVERTDAWWKVEEGEDWASKYLVVLRRTYQVVKEVAPNVQVVGGTVTNPGALPPLIKGGGLGYMDIGAFHWSSWSPEGYLRNTGEEVGFLGPKQNWVNCIERITDATRERGKDIPLWNTECHITQADVEREFVTQPPLPKVSKTPLMTRLDAAAAVPRQYIAEWAAGVDKTFYWLLSCQSSSWDVRADKTMLEWDRSPTAPVVTYAVMTSQLEDAEFVDWEKKTGATWPERPFFWIFHFRKPGGRLRVVWSNTDTPHEIVLPVTGRNVIIRDMFGAECPAVKVNSQNDAELEAEIMLSVARSPFYILEED